MRMLDAQFPRSWAAMPHHQQLAEACRKHLGPLRHGQYGFGSAKALNMWIFREVCAHWKSHHPPNDGPAAAGESLEAEDMQSSLTHAKELVAALSWSSPIVPPVTHGESRNPRLHAHLAHLASIATLDGRALERRRGALERVVGLVRTAYPDAQLQIFGSSATGLTLPSSDIDLVACIPAAASKKPLRKLEGALRQAGHRKGLELILGAKVPLLKFTEQSSGLPFDLCVNSTNGVENSTFIRKRLETYPALRPLLLALKCLLHQHGLHDTFTGGIGGYLLFLMVLRVVVRIWERGNEGSYGVTTRDRIGDLGKQLRAVLGTYSTQRTLEIYDPLSEGGAKDIGAKTFRFDEVKRLFQRVDARLAQTDCLSAVLCGWPAAHSNEAGSSATNGGLANYDALVRLCKSTFRKPPQGRTLSNPGGGGGGGKRKKMQHGGGGGGGGVKRSGGGGSKAHGRKGGGDAGGGRKGGSWKGEMASAIAKAAKRDRKALASKVGKAGGGAKRKGGNRGR